MGHGPGSLLIFSIGQWDRPPNWLLVDFYNYGPEPGSVFEVAAQANGVPYNRECCGTNSRSLAVAISRPSEKHLALLTAVVIALLF